MMTSRLVRYVVHQACNWAAWSTVGDEQTDAQPVELNMSPIPNINRSEIYFSYKYFIVRTSRGRQNVKKNRRYISGGRAPRILNFGNELRSTVCFTTPSPLLRHPSHRKLGGPHSLSGRCTEKNNSFLLARIGNRTHVPRYSDPQPSRCSNWAIPVASTKVIIL